MGEQVTDEFDSQDVHAGILYDKLLYAGQLFTEARGLGEVRQARTQLDELLDEVNEKGLAGHIGQIAISESQG